MRRVYSPIKTKIIFEFNHTFCAIEFATVEIHICMQRVSAVYIPERHCTVNTLVSTDVYKFEQKQAPSTPVGNVSMLQSARDVRM